MPTPKQFTRMQMLFGFLGLAIAAPFFVWLPLGILEAVPSMVDVFGIEGLRTPVGVTVFGLLMAAVSFWKD